MKLMVEETPTVIFAGRLSREYVILPSGEVLLDVPGGNTLYSAVGFYLWEPDPPPGILARVGEDYPQVWLEEFSNLGFDVRGVKIIPNAVDVRSFFAFADIHTPIREDPVAQFARAKLPFPKALLGYQGSNIEVDSRTRYLPTSLRKGDILPLYLDATAIHICPLDYMSHSLLPAILRQEGFTTVTLDPSPGYMNPTYWGDVPSLLTGLTAFMPSEEEVRDLFQGRSSDLWEMAEAMAAYGCEFVIIKRGEIGQLLYDTGGKTHWEVPSYPSRLVNPIGAGDAFCGGFLAGYRRTYDPLKAVLHGSISASLVVEGNRVTYALEALPGLPQARLEALAQSVRKV